MAVLDPTPSGAQHILLPFLYSQSQTSLTRLYTRPSACLAIYRLLSPLERQIIMSLLWLESSVPASVFASWVHPNKVAKQQYDTAISSLTRLHIIPSTPGTLAKLLLHPTFKASFRTALTGGGTHQSFGVPADKGEKRSVNVEFLDSYAVERWETILHYMVSSGTGQSPVRPSQGVLYLLQRSGLMSAFGGGSVLRITSAGFQFLLHPPHSQLWDLLLQYLHMAEERRMDLVGVLSFLFMLSTMELGQDYSTENLDQTQNAMLEDLRDYGLVWQRKTSSRRFHPTRLATTLTSSLPPLPSSTTTSGTDHVASQGFIILETNYRMYAYTNNPLQIAVLNLFTTLKSRFPNLIVGALTRDSVRKALSNGITAEQIVSYLTTHAHPQMRKNVPLLPVTVQDQIRLWEREKNRVQADEGFLYTGFASQIDYEYVLNYARQLDVVVWENAESRCFFGRADGHESIKGYVTRLRADANGGGGQGA
ncbi:hypothetical protein BOTBODRAFT_29852 [Botryobasidium botryosum FD-172 SS1]|uniref:RNA polymerase II transcription factor B subunit 2 n=1 Tax=Botryobasidium botryosum (strain FD-172 SS1) TaxID=930990 RepID=A0A067N1M3_BOTB1|nr:hypothetical protein BOTBODRAFT_29852 [Botryobasidium botryosum FD-172 SS1]